MEIIRLDRDELSNARAGITNTLPYRSTVQTDNEVASGWDSFAAGWERDHAETALYKTVDRWMTGDNTDQPDPEFNPYGYISKTWDDSRKARMALAIDDGLFDDLQGPWAVEQQAAKIERDFELDQKLAANPWSGFAGSLAANIFTLTNLIPIAGWSSKASLLGNVGRMALGAAISQVPNELVLRAEHPMRSWSESIMNIGTAGVIGGGLGAFSHALNKGHALANLEADLLEGKPVSIRHAGEEEVDVVNDLSAASNPDIRRKFWLQDRPIEVIGGKIVGNLVKYANKVTPTGRLLNAMSPEVHKVALSLLDTGGVLFRTVKGYISPGPSAEDIKRIMVNLTKDHVFAEASRTFIGMNKKLGEQGFKKIDLQTFQNVTRDKLIGAWNAGDAEKLVTDLDDLILVTDIGKVIRIRVRDVRVQGRNTQGVRLIRLGAEERVVAVEALHEPGSEEAEDTLGEDGERIDGTTSLPDGNEPDEAEGDADAAEDLGDEDEDLDDGDEDDDEGSEDSKRGKR